MHTRLQKGDEMAVIISHISSSDVGIGSGTSQLIATHRPHNVLVFVCLFVFSPLWFTGIFFISQRVGPCAHYMVKQKIKTGTDFYALAFGMRGGALSSRGFTLYTKETLIVNARRGRHYSFRARAPHTQHRR